MIEAAAAMAMAKTASSIFSGLKSNNKASGAYKKQSNLANKEYSYNKNELIKSFKSNLEINFSNTALEMFDITKQYISNYSNLNTLTSKYYGTGLSYSSGVTDAKNEVSNELETKLKQSTYTRDYTESNLASQFTSNLYQLNLNKEKTDLGLTTTLNSVIQQNNQSMFNSVVEGATSIYNLSAEAGGFSNLFIKK